MKGKIFAAIVVILLILGVGYYFMSRQAKAPDQLENSNTSGQVKVPEQTSGTPANSDVTPSGQTQTLQNANGSDYTPPGGHFSTESDVQAPPPTAKTVTVTVSASGFSPSSVTINAGDTVKFVNNSSDTVQPASDPHPSHTDYPGFDSKPGIAPGQSYSFTFTKVGTWGYHNHLNPVQHGTIIVK